MWASLKVVLYTTRTNTTNPLRKQGPYIAEPEETVNLVDD